MGLGFVCSLVTVTAGETLICLLAKETWEPVIEELFKLDVGGKIKFGSPLIREAWALDCQNHGEAGILNAEVLARNPGLLSAFRITELHPKKPP